MEASLRLYRDVIGMAVNYDTVVTTSGVALPAGAPGAKARLVLLNANDPWVGWVGLMQWTDPPLANPGPYSKRIGPGVTFTSEPRLQEYPGRAGAPPIRVMGCNFFDPDGILIEMNQILK